MFHALSPIAPSPFSGWVGSTLQCCRCKHVRPIQNTPFLDIAIVPTAIKQNYTVSAAAAAPCSLAKCLQDYCAMERVKDVECGNCTKLHHLKETTEEVTMLRDAIHTVKTRHGGNTTILERDLRRAEALHERVYSLHPDDNEDVWQEVLMHVQAHNHDQHAWDLSSPSSTKPLEKLRTHANKCLMLTRLPTILCLHVQRRYYHCEGMHKSTQHVEFSVHLQIQSVRYVLESVVEHVGNAFGGHYVCYRRSAASAWYRISDARVVETSWQAVSQCQAYMLFYRAI